MWEDLPSIGGRLVRFVTSANNRMHTETVDLWMEYETKKPGPSISEWGGGLVTATEAERPRLLEQGLRSAEPTGS